MGCIIDTSSLGILLSAFLRSCSTPTVLKILPPKDRKVTLGGTKKTLIPSGTKTLHHPKCTIAGLRRRRTWLLFRLLITILALLSLLAVLVIQQLRV